MKLYKTYHAASQIAKKKNKKAKKGRYEVVKRYKIVKSKSLLKAILTA